MEKTKKGLFAGVVRFNRQIGGRFYRLGLQFEGEAAKTFANFIPGQFAEIDISSAALPPIRDIPENLKDKANREILLRRPFSFCSVESKDGETQTELLYCVLGPATLRMTTLAEGDTISIIGPLGNGFTIPKGKQTALLVTGGTGAPPVLHLAKTLSEKYPEIKTAGFIGAKSAADFPLEEIQDKNKETLKSLTDITFNGVTWHLSSDEGDIGYKGLVTDKLEEWLGNCNADKSEIIIYGCGPEAMLAKVAKIAENFNVDCQVSTERMMACGIGICQGCAIECKSGGSGNVYKLCCKDGPVFDSRELVFRI